MNVFFFQSKISFLQGERRGQENLKNNLIRRIKMLELALKQERVKYHKLMYGVEPNTNELKSNTSNTNLSNENNGKTPKKRKKKFRNFKNSNM